MYCASETVTIVQFDRTTQEYTCVAVDGVSWHTTSRRYLQNTEEKESAETNERIQEECMPTGLTIRANDIVCRRKVTGISRRADLEPYERFTVTEVRDNRRGKRLRHWAVIGA